MPNPISCESYKSSFYYFRNQYAWIHLLYVAMAGIRLDLQAIFRWICS